MKKLRYDSALGALFSESARGLSLKDQTSVMTELSRAFSAMDKEGVQIGGQRIGNATLSIDWLQSADNQQQLLARLHGDTRRHVQQGLQRLQGARVKYDDGRRANMITMPEADGQS
ncbi:MAG: hypothetical protein JKY71_03415 [Alphaproteobacteria bacterium]|nr:hypothetical protein [Alphaproteobacteria bacterium]